jgi:hypothetical protein
MPIDKILHQFYQDFFFNNKGQFILDEFITILGSFFPTNKTITPKELNPLFKTK